MQVWSLATVSLCALLPLVTPQYEGTASECTPSDTYLNALINTATKQSDKLEAQTGVYQILLGSSNSTETETDLMVDPMYWEALGTSFVDVDQDGVPDAFDDGLLSAEEILANPQSQLFLSSLAKNIANQHGIPPSQIQVSSVSADLGARRRLGDATSRHPIPVTLTYTTGLS